MGKGQQVTRKEECHYHDEYITLKLCILLVEIWCPCEGRDVTTWFTLLPVVFCHGELDESKSMTTQPLSGQGESLLGLSCLAENLLCLLRSYFDKF